MEEMTRGGEIVDEVPGEETSDRNGAITSDADGGGGGGSAIAPISNYYRMMRSA